MVSQSSGEGGRRSSPRDGRMAAPNPSTNLQCSSNLAQLDEDDLWNRIVNESERPSVVCTRACHSLDYTAGGLCIFLSCGILLKPVTWITLWLCIFCIVSFCCIFNKVVFCSKENQPFLYWEVTGSETRLNLFLRVWVCVQARAHVWMFVFECVFVCYILMAWSRTSWTFHPWCVLKFGELALHEHKRVLGGSRWICRCLSTDAVFLYPMSNDHVGCVKTLVKEPKGKETLNAANLYIAYVWSVDTEAWLCPPSLGFWKGKQPALCL